MFSPVSFVGFAKNKDQQASKIAGLCSPLKTTGFTSFTRRTKSLKDQKNN